MKKKAKLLSVMTCILLIASVVLTSCGLTADQIKKDPAGYLNSAALNTMKAMFSDNQSMFNHLKNAMNGGSVQVQYSDSEEAEALTNTLYFGKDTSSLMNSLELVYGDESLDLDLWAADGALAAKSETLFGDDVAYGFKLVDIVEDSEFTDAFEEKAGFSFSDLTDALAEVFSEDQMEELEKVYNDLYNNKTESVEKKDVEVLGETASMFEVVIKVDNDFMKTVYDAYLDFLSPLALNDEMEESIVGPIKDIQDALKDATVDGTVAAYLTAKGELNLAMIVWDITVSTDEEKEQVTMNLSFGADPVNSDTIQFTMESSTFSIDVIFETADTDDMLELSCKITVGNPAYGSSQETKLALAYTKDSGDYEMSLKSYGMTTIISGNYSSDDKGFELTVDSYKLSGEYYDDIEAEIGLTITVLAQNDMPAMPEYTDLASMSDEEVEALFAAVSQNETLAGIMASMSGYGSYGDYDYDIGWGYNNEYYGTVYYNYDYEMDGVDPATLNYAPAGYYNIVQYGPIEYDYEEGDFYSDTTWHAQWYYICDEDGYYYKTGEVLYADGVMYSEEWYNFDPSTGAILERYEAYYYSNGDKSYEFFYDAYGNEISGGYVL